MVNTIIFYFDWKNTKLCGEIIMQFKNIVIPSVREMKYLSLSCKAKSPIILLSNTDIGNLMLQVDYVHKHGKQAFAHLELIGGFAPDIAGMKLLKNMYHLDGVFTTNIQAGNMAKNLGLIVVYRFFLIDSRSLKRTSEILRKNKFDAIETLPAYCAMQEFADLQQLGSGIPFIAGGFVRDSKMVAKIFAAGMCGITTSKTELWD
jgi:glycerol uptake operon antiterminator